MKCIKSKAGEIRRVVDSEAESKVKIHGWTYVQKSEWKSQVRDFNKK